MRLSLAQRSDYLDYLADDDIETTVEDLNYDNIRFTDDHSQIDFTAKYYLNDNLTLKDGRKKISIKPIKVKHGKVDSICYIIDKKLAYISDVNQIFEKDFKHLKNLNYLVLDCLWINHHPSHLNLEESLDLIFKLNPKKAILTNLSPVLDYDYLKKVLPKKVIPAFDGLTINL